MNETLPEVSNKAGIKELRSYITVLLQGQEALRAEIEELKAQSQPNGARSAKNSNVTSDHSLRVKDRFYYVIFTVPAGTLGDEPQQVFELLLSNFTRMCRRSSYGVGAAVCVFEEATLTLHGLVRSRLSLPTTPAALANCNRLTRKKEKGQPVAHYAEGIHLVPLNKGKGAYITTQGLESFLKFLVDFGDIHPVIPSELDNNCIYADVPNETLIDVEKRFWFDSVSRAMVKGGEGEDEDFSQ